MRQDTINNAAPARDCVADMAVIQTPSGERGVLIILVDRLTGAQHARCYPAETFDARLIDVLGSRP